MEALDNAWYGSWRPLTNLMERVICALLMWPPFFFWGGRGGEGGHSYIWRTTVHHDDCYKQNGNHTNLWMIFCCCMRSASCGMWPCRFWYEIIRGMIFMYAQCKKWNNSYPILVWNSYRCFCWDRSMYIVASVVWMHKKATTVLPNTLLATKTISKQPAFSKSRLQTFATADYNIYRLQYRSMKRFLALSTLLAVLLAAHCYPG